MPQTNTVNQLYLDLKNNNKNNWHIALCKFKVYSMLIWYIYGLNRMITTVAFAHLTSLTAVFGGENSEGLLSEQPADTQCSVVTYSNLAVHWTPALTHL